MTTPTRLPISTLTPGAPFRQYTLLEQIGVGGQGVVWSALDAKMEGVYAIKFNEILDTSEGMAEDFRDEFQLERLVNLRHVRILPVQEYGFEGGVRFTVSPYIPGGTLTQRVRNDPLPIEEALRIGMEVASALDYLHGQGVIHRDLKSSNILLDLGNHTYLADFGLARIVSTSTLAFHTGHGTPPYAPPEQNRQRAITPKSDIFSFGILLYEIFTGQLPWNGKKQLGMEQLHSSQQLPDPRTLNPNLEPRTVDVLRRATSANPDLRPRSAGEVMRMLHYIFGIPYQPLDIEKEPDRQAARRKDVDELLWQGLSQWKATNGMHNLGLTRFALVDLERVDINMEMFSSFLLAHALTYGYQDEHWWVAVSDPRERLSISSLLLKRENEAIAVRILQRLAGDMEIRAFSRGLPEGMITSLLETGIKTNNQTLREQILRGTRTFTRPPRSWNGSSLDPYLAQRLGDLALEDSESGDAAAELIGHLRATPAVQVVTGHRNEDRKIAALLLIQRTAGSLPSLVGGNLRTRLTTEWILQRLVQKPVSLASAYVLAFLGASLGVGIQAYMTYNLPEFLDVARFTTSLERGLIIGAVFGLGVFITRVAVERFRTSAVLPRLLLGTVLGAMAMNISLLVFHLLFLTTPPMGFTITSACFFIAFTFAAGGLTRSYLLKVFFSSLSILVAILGTWWIHINLAASPVDLAPVFRYDYEWSLARVAATAALVALPIGMFGNMVNLSLTDEQSLS